MSPAAPADADGLFRATVVFVMASGGADLWRDTVTVTPAGGGEHVLVFDALPVVETGALRSLGGTDYRFTLNWDRDRYGVAEVNPFTLTAHTRPTDPMTPWPAATDLSITVMPWMPSMEHGSWDNVDPVHTVDGEYLGSVNFSMPDDWTVTFEITREGVLQGEIVYDLWIL